jgi:hypothetical protein
MKKINKITGVLEKRNQAVRQIAENWVLHNKKSSVAGKNK